MDTGHNYITMCKKAIEIQRLARIPSVRPSSSIMRIDNNYWYANSLLHTSRLEFIWLPTQSQLQRMLLKANTYEAIQELMDKFNEFWMWYNDGFTSMEQLWLAFVMREKYLKRWWINGKKWIELKKL